MIFFWLFRGFIIFVLIQVDLSTQTITEDKDTLFHKTLPSFTNTKFEIKKSWNDHASLKQPHALFDVLQWDNWRNELVSLRFEHGLRSESNAIKIGDESSSDPKEEPSENFCRTFTIHEPDGAVIELFLPIRIIANNVHLQVMDSSVVDGLQSLSKINLNDVKFDEVSNTLLLEPRCETFKVVGITSQDVKLAESAKFIYINKGPVPELQVAKKVLYWSLLSKDLEINRSALRVLALYWWNKGNATACLHCLQRQLLLADNDEERRNVKFMLAQIYSLCGWIEKAIELHTEVAQQSQQPLPVPYFFLAGVLAFQSEYERALQAYEMGIKLCTEEVDARVSAAIKYCKCRLKELNRLKDEQKELEAELNELNNINKAVEREIVLKRMIVQKSISEKQMLESYLMYFHLKHGPIPGVECRGEKSIQNRNFLSCQVQNVAEFVNNGLPLHDDYIENFGTLFRHEKLVRNYDARRRLIEASYVKEMGPFLNALKPYVGMKMDEPLTKEHKYRRLQSATPFTRNMQSLCSTKLTPSTQSRLSASPVVVDPASRGYPASELLNKYLNLKPNTRHPLPWDQPYCEIKTHNLSVAIPIFEKLMSLQTLLETDRHYAPEVALLPYLAQLIGLASEDSFLLAEFGQRVRILMKLAIGPRWLLNDLATLYFRALGLFREALECIAQSLSEMDPIEDEHADMVFLQLANVLRNFEPIPGVDEDLALVVKMATLNKHYQHPAIEYMAALTAKAQEKSLAHLWSTYNIEPNYRPAVETLQEHYCNRKVAKSYLPPPIAIFVVGFIRPASEVREKKLDKEIGALLRSTQQKQRKSKTPPIMFPLDYGGFSKERIDSVCTKDEPQPYTVVSDQFLDSNYLSFEIINDTKLSSDPKGLKPKMETKAIVNKVAEVDEETLKNWEDAMNDYEREDHQRKDFLSADEEKPSWHNVVNYDDQLPTELPYPSQDLFMKGKTKFKLPKSLDLDVFCRKTDRKKIFAPVSTYFSITAKGLSISSVVDLKSPLNVALHKIKSEPLCPSIFSSNSVSLLQNVAAYRHKDRLIYYKPETGLRDTLLSLGTPSDSVETMGARLSMAIGSNEGINNNKKKIHWALSTLAALYWRVKGNATEAVTCLMHSLNNAPEDKKDVAAIGLANIYHQAGFLNSALLAGHYALQASGGNVVSIHFALANIYTSLNKFDLALQFYYSTVALQSNFQEGKDRIMALHCDFSRVS